MPFQSSQSSLQVNEEPITRTVNVPDGANPIFNAGKITGYSFDAEKYKGNTRNLAEIGQPDYEQTQFYSPMLLNWANLSVFNLIPNKAVAIPFDITKATTVTEIFQRRNSNAGSAGSKFNWCIYKANDDYIEYWGNWTIAIQSSEFPADSNGDFIDILPTPITLQPGRYYYALQHNSTTNVGFMGAALANIKNCTYLEKPYTYQAVTNLAYNSNFYQSYFRTYDQPFGINQGVLSILPLLFWKTL